MWFGHQFRRNILPYKFQYPGPLYLSQYTLLLTAKNWRKEMKGCEKWEAMVDKITTVHASHYNRWHLPLFRPRKYLEQPDLPCEQRKKKGGLQSHSGRLCIIRNRKEIKETQKIGVSSKLVCEDEVNWSRKNGTYQRWTWLRPRGWWWKQSSFWWV